MPTWSLVIPTYNRRDVLLRVLPLALRQTVPPIQVVIVDSSQDWDVTRQAVQGVAADHPGIRLDYLQATTPSSATQRNQGVEQAIGDIVVMIDDDSFLYPDYVERILAVYAADADGVVAGVNGVNVSRMPDAQAVTGLARKADNQDKVRGLRSRIMQYRLGRWISSRILFQDMHALFLKYEGDRALTVPAGFAHLDVVPMTFMSGHGLSVRRSVALAEPLDRSLRYYAALAWLGTYRRMLWRRLLGETIKDALSRRWDFPQARGVLTAMNHWRRVWNTPVEELDEWYPGHQRAILDRL